MRGRWGISFVLLLFAGVVAAGCGDSDGGGAEGEVEVGSDPRELDAVGDSLWVVNGDGLTEIDAAASEVVGEPASDIGNPVAIDATDDIVWVANFEGVIPVDATTHEVGELLPVDVGDNNLAGVAATEGAVWSATLNGQSVVRVDTESAEVEAIDLGGYPNDVAATADAVWVSDAGEQGDPGTVHRIDPATNEVVASIEVGQDPSNVVATDDAVWVVSSGSNTVSRIDPTTNEVVATVGVDDDPSQVVIGDSKVFVRHFTSSTITEIDPSTNEVVNTVQAQVEPNSIAAIGDDVWLSSGHDEDQGLVSLLDPAS